MNQTQGESSAHLLGLLIVLDSLERILALLRQLALLQFLQTSLHLLLHLGIIRNLLHRFA